MTEIDDQGHEEQAETAGSTAPSSPESTAAKSLSTADEDEDGLSIASSTTAQPALHQPKVPETPSFSRRAIRYSDGAHIVRWVEMINHPPFLKHD
jgi:hypothetical protein